MVLHREDAEASTPLDDRERAEPPLLGIADRTKLAAWRTLVRSPSAKSSSPGSAEATMLKGG
jgi:hypothetical protein